jgi:hypothetical protein
VVNAIRHPPSNPFEHLNLEDFGRQWPCCWGAVAAAAIACTRVARCRHCVPADTAHMAACLPACCRGQHQQCRCKLGTPQVAGLQDCLCCLVRGVVSRQGGKGVCTTTMHGCRLPLIPCLAC